MGMTARDHGRITGCRRCCGICSRNRQRYGNRLEDLHRDVFSSDQKSNEWKNWIEKRFSRSFHFVTDSNAILRRRKCAIHRLPIKIPTCHRGRLEADHRQARQILSWP